MSEADFDLELAEEEPRGLTDRQLLERWKSEVDDYHRKLRTFDEVEPDEIFIHLAGITARASEIRKDLMRMNHRAANAFRIHEIDPLITECDRQFKFWSRMVTVRGIDAQLAGAL